MRKDRRGEHERTESRAERSGTERGKRSSEGRERKKGSTRTTTADQSRQGQIIWRPADWNVQRRVAHNPRTGSSGGVGPVPRTETSRARNKQQGPLDWSIRGKEETRGQAQGARTRVSGEERAGKQQGPPDWNILGAETLGWNIWG